MSRMLVGLLLVTACLTPLEPSAPDDRVVDDDEDTRPGPDIEPGEPLPAFEPSADARLRRATSCAEVEEYAAHLVLEELVRLQLMHAEGLDLDADTDTDIDTDGDSSAPTELTEPDREDASVVTLDTVATDGQHLYTVSRRSVFVARVWPVDALEAVASIELDEHVEGLLLQGDRLLVVTRRGSWQRWEQLLHVYDVSDPTRPSRVEQLVLTGQAAGAAAVGGRLTVASSWVPFPDDDLRGLVRALDRPDVDTEAGARALLSPYAVPMVRERDPASWRPSRQALGEDAELVPCTDLYLPGELRPMSWATVTELDLDRPGETVHSLGFVGSGASLRVTAERVWLFSTSLEWFTWHGEGPVTRIHQLDRRDGERLAPHASVELPGHVYSPFAMGPADDGLRVATTGRGNRATSDLYLLDDDLSVVGHVGDLGQGEYLHAARFIGDRAYLVTFRTVDPLYVIDLAIPESPTVLGELKLPGFSAFLHGYSEDRLLGVGVTEDESGRQRWLAVNLFDVRDPASPALMDQVVREGRYASRFSWEQRVLTRRGDTVTVLSVDYGEDHVPSYRADVLRIADEGSSIDPVGSWSPSTPMSRAFYLDDWLLLVGASGVTSHALSDPSTAVDTVGFYP